MKGYTPNCSFRSYASSCDSEKDPSLHSNIVQILHTDDVFQKYEVKELLGTGSMGTVSIVHKKHEKVGGSAFECYTPTTTSRRGFLGIPGLFIVSTQRQQQKQLTTPLKDRPNDSEDYLYALKTIQLDRISSTYIDELHNEINILRTLDHPNIIKVHEVYERYHTNNNNWQNRQQIYVVLELCTGGDLFTRSPYSQKEAARIVEQICSAVRYLHDHNVVHRDLKYENIMFENTSQYAQIKIIDFGLSKKFLPNDHEKNKMTELVGTMYTIAPQVLQGVYSSQADMWSIGVITYMLLTSSRPFYHKHRRRMIDQIMRGAVAYNPKVWSTIDREALHFVQSLLIVDPKLRMDAYDALHHPWIYNRELLPDEKPTDELLSLVDNSIINYHANTSALKKIALNVMAHKSTKSEIYELRKVFDSFDQEKDGILTFTEFKNGLQSTFKDHGTISDEFIEDLFVSIDVNHTGVIMYTEFLAATLEAHGQIAEDVIAEAFDRFDSDDTGYITRQNIRDALGGDCTEEEVDEIIECADYDHDGKISYQEFLRNFREKRQEMVRRMSVSLPLQDSMNKDSCDNDITNRRRSSAKEQHSMPFLVQSEGSLSTSSSSSSSLNGNDENLLGLDAKIPGGKYSSELQFIEEAASCTIM